MIYLKILENEWCRKWFHFNINFLFSCHFNFLQWMFLLSIFTGKKHSLIFYDLQIEPLSLSILIIRWPKIDNSDMIAANVVCTRQLLTCFFSRSVRRDEFKVFEWGGEILTHVKQTWKGDSEKKCFSDTSLKWAQYFIFCLSFRYVSFTRVCFWLTIINNHIEILFVLCFIITQNM